MIITKLMDAPAPERQSGAGDDQPGAAPGQPPRAFAQIYDQQFSFVWANLRRMGVRPCHLEDAAQDVFVVVHRQLSGFEGRSSMRTWLAGIAWRVASEYRRREARKGTDPLPDSLPAPGPDPHRAAVNAEALRLLDELLRVLDDDKRVVFVLAELEQMTVPEIAEALGVNLNTVYKRLGTARKLFDQALHQHNGRAP